MRNQVIRDAAKAAHVNLWEVAERLGVSEMTVTRLLRRNLDAETTAKLLALIAELATKKAAE